MRETEASFCPLWSIAVNTYWPISADTALDIVKLYLGPSEDIFIRAFFSSIGRPSLDHSTIKKAELLKFHLNGIWIHVLTNEEAY